MTNIIINIDYDYSDLGGKILVHCRSGASCSATIVLAYLMMKENKSVKEATRIVR